MDSGSNRNKLVSDLVNEMQAGVNQPSNGLNPIMNQYGGMPPGMQPLQQMQPMQPMQPGGAMYGANNGIGPQLAPTMGNPIMSAPIEIPHSMIAQEDMSDMQDSSSDIDEYGEIEEPNSDDDNSNDSSSTLDKFMDMIKQPLIGSLILIFLSLPQFNMLLNSFLPIISENILYNLLFKALLFAVLFYLITSFLR